MRILIDIGHPGHVHLFKVFAKEMIRKGHIILFTCRQKEFEIELLEDSGFNYISFGQKYNSTIGKFWGLLKFDLKMFNVALSFEPDIFLSAGSMYAAQISAIMRKPHIAFEDTGNMEQVRLYKPFTNTILTADIFHKKLGENQIRYAGYHELAYLHPNVFSPNKKILDKYIFKKKSVLLRFVAWNATHDIGQGGFSLEDKINVATSLNKSYDVFISSESILPKDLDHLRLNIEPGKIHDVMSCVDLFIGEGATMASECAVLGTPAIYVNSMEAGTIDDQEKYGLLFHYRKSDGILEKAEEILNNNQSKKMFIQLKNKMLEDKIDVSAFLIWFIENYPNSKKLMKDNPNYPYKFQ